MARLECKGMILKANSAYASKLPQNPKKRRINTIFNQFRNSHARSFTTKYMSYECLTKLVMLVVSVFRELIGTAQAVRFVSASFAE